jgi:hypothetical protein
MLANLMFQRGDIEQALHHFKQLFSKKPGIFTLNNLCECRESG